MMDAMADGALNVFLGFVIGFCTCGFVTWAVEARKERKAEREARLQDQIRNIIWEEQKKGKL